MKKIFIVTTTLVSLLTLLASPLQVAAQDLEANKEIARRYLEEIWNNGDMAVADEIIAEDFVNHNPFGPLPPDLEGLKIAASGMAAAPGNFTLDDIIAEGDMVAIHTPYHGNPAFDGIVILRIKDGKITDRWGYTDHGPKFAEANKEIAHRYMEEIWNNGDMAVADEIIAEDFVNHNPFGPLPPDREGLKIVAAGGAAAPGNYAIDDMIAEGDTVAVRSPFHGDFEFETIFVLRIKDGKITERWGYGDHDLQVAEANKVLATRYMEELWQEGKLELADELLSEDFVSHVFPEGGREAIKAAVTGFNTDLPNGYFLIDDMIVTADKIVIRASIVANAPPEGTEPERIDPHLLVLSVKDGKITDRWIGFVPSEEK